VRTKFQKDGIEILECRACGLAFWVPDTEFRPEGVYGPDYFGGAGAGADESAGAGSGYDDYASLEPALRASFAKRLKSALPAKPGARLLDVGAALGFGVSEAASAGFAAFGLEVSRSAARGAATVAPGTIVAANGLHLPFRAASFDAVALWDVLEHLSDPAAALREIARVLVPGGRLLLTTGDVGSLLARFSGARWHLYTLPEHLFFFSRRSLRLLLAAAGFEIERMRAESSVYPLWYLVERLRKTLLGRSGASSANWMGASSANWMGATSASWPIATPASWPGAGLRVPLNLFDIVTVHAVKGSVTAGAESAK
jgi:SAM-dependent methyltransferase